MTKKFLFSICLLLFSENSSAQILAGGEIYYELIGPLNYKVTAHVYRMCQTSPLSSLSGYVAADTMRQNIVYTRTAIKKINDTCGNPCKKENDFSNPGYEKHTYVAFIDFTLNPYKKFVLNGKCSVNFAVQQSGRLSSSTHSTGLFYIDAGVNLCDTNIKSNHSPIFSMDPKFLIYYSQPLKYSPGPLDSMDYDSLAFSLEPVQTSYNQNVSYNSNYSAQIPLTPYCPPNPGVTSCKALPNSSPPRGFYFDQLYCRMVFTPTNSTELSYVKIKVCEYRRIKGQMIYLGFTSREMLMSVKTVSNNNPASFIKPSNPTKYFICSEKTTINITTKDEQFLPKQLYPDTTHIFWDQGFSKSQMVVNDSFREQSAVLNLSPDAKTKGKWQYFTIAAYDQGCNIGLVSMTNLALQLETPGYKKTYTIDSCNHFSYNIRLDDTGKSIVSSLYVFDSAHKPISTVNGSNYTFNRNGKHFLQYNFSLVGFPCTYRCFDTLNIINAVYQANLNIGNDTQICASYPATLKFNPSKNKNLKDIQWYRNDTLFLSGDSMYKTNIFTNTRFSIHLIDQRNCSSDKQIQFTIIKPGTNLLFSSYPGVCPRDSIRIIANASSSLKKPFQYQWSTDGNLVGKNSDTLVYQLSDSNRIRLRVTDDNHCIVNDSTDIVPLSVAKLNLRSISLNNCFDSVFKVQIDSIKGLQNMLQWMHVGKDTVYNKSYTYTLLMKENSTIKAAYINSNLCKSIDSIFIPVIPNPVINAIGGKNSVCADDSILQTLKLKPYSGSLSIQWQFNSQFISGNDSLKWLQSDTSGMLYVKVAYEGKCISETIKHITVYPVALPLRIVTDTFYNPLNKIELSTNNIYNLYNWFNASTSRSNSFWASELGAPGKHGIWCRVMDANGCRSSDTIDIYTDQRLGTMSQGLLALNVYPNPFSQNVFIETFQNTDIKVYASDGRLILDQALGEGKNTLQLEALCKGIYLFKIGTLSLWLVKE